MKSMQTLVRCFSFKSLGHQGMKHRVYSTKQSLSTFDDYVNKAQKLLATSDFTRPVANVAASMQEMEMEKDHEIDCLRAKAHKDISWLSQRTVLECLFRKAAILIQEDNALHEMVTLSPLTKNDKILAKKGVRATNSSINEVLLIENNRKYIWKCLKIPQEVQLPVIAGDLLYGDVSMTIHSPGFVSVYISSSAPQDYIEFYKEVIKALAPKKTITFYDESKAARGEEKFGIA